MVRRLRLTSCWKRRTGVGNYIWVSVLLLAIGLAAPRAIHAADASNKTLQNLQSAYSSESNAHVKYLELAKQADSEGYGKVASLFRAAAAAVQIHLTCEATVIKEMDAMPQTDVKAAPVKFVFGAAVAQFLIADKFVATMTVIGAAALICAWRKPWPGVTDKIRSDS
jgi:hypothetical protein